VEAWLDELRRDFDDALTRDWRSHVRALNVELGLIGSDALVELDRPPEYFWGDLDALVPGAWVAVVSLNPQITGAEWDEWYDRQRWDAQGYWDYLNRRDLREGLDGTPFEPRDYYYARFARPLVKLAGAALRIADPVADEVAIAMRRMAFFEILPFPSKSYVPRPEQAARLAREDPGCLTATRAALGAIRERSPAVVLVNGGDAVHVFGAVHGVQWREMRYASTSRPSKTLRHFEGEIVVGSARVPLIGFPQLRGMSSHNSNPEIEQLAARVAEVASA